MEARAASSGCFDLHCKGLADRQSALSAEEGAFTGTFVVSLYTLEYRGVCDGRNDPWIWPSFVRDRAAVAACDSSGCRTCRRDGSTQRWQQRAPWLAPRSWFGRLIL